MIRRMFLASLVAASMPALAQTADPGTITVENTPEQQALADRAVPLTVATEGEVKLAVDTQWFKFDRDRNGGLDQTEFGAMLHKFRKAAAATLKDGEADEARADTAAFAVADVDKNGAVNRDEFVALLKSPAA